MKAFLATCAVAFATAACGPVFAAEYAAENNAGGHLVLTEEPCPVDGAPANVRGAFTYSATGDLALGCWTLAGDRVLVIWLDDGTVIEYAMSLFRKVDASTRPSTGKRGERDA